MMLELPPSWMISPYSRHLAMKLISASRAVVSVSVSVASPVHLTRHRLTAVLGHLLIVALDGVWSSPLSLARLVVPFRQRCPGCR
jgi:hypothetical protein